MSVKTGKVTAPWQTIPNESLGVKSDRVGKVVAGDKYELQSPWTKKGNNRDEEMSAIRKGIETRQERRAEVYQAEKALRDLSKDTNEDMQRRMKEYRATRLKEATKESEKGFETRKKQVETTKKNMAKMTIEKKEQEKTERLAAQKEAQKSVDSKRRMLASEKKEVVDERRKSIEKGIKVAEATSKLQRERREESVAYKKKMALEHEQKAIAKAEKLRQERLEDERRARIHRMEARERKNIKAAWVEDEKLTNKVRTEQLLQERAESMQARALLAKQSAENARQGKKSFERHVIEQKERSNSIKSAQKKAWQSEAQDKRDQVNAHMEARHLRAVERKRLERKEFHERNVAPLERRAEFGRQRKVEEKVAVKQHQSSMQKEMEERRARKAQLLARDRELATGPLVLG